MLHKKIIAPCSCCTFARAHILFKTVRARYIAFLHLSVKTIINIDPEITFIQINFSLTLRIDSLAQLANYYFSSVKGRCQMESKHESLDA